MRRDEVNSEEPDSGIFPLIEVARTALGQLTPEQWLRGELAMGRRTKRARAKRAPRQMRLLVMVPLTGALIGAAFVLRHVIRPDAPSFGVGFGSVNEAQLTQPSGTSASILRFPDGTEIRLYKGTRARGGFTTQKGAVLAIDRGQMHARVVHSSKPERWFEAGPFSVRATGTEFGLDWQPERDRFDLRVESGSVLVTAPVANDPIPVRAGQWLTVRNRSNELLIRNLTAGTANAATAANVP